VIKEDIKSWAFFRRALLRSLIITCLFVILHRVLHWKIELAIIISTFGVTIGQIIWKYYLLPSWTKSCRKGT
jgi:hypothetical protein